MPTICYKGAQKAGLNAGRLGFFQWGVPRAVSEEWLGRYRSLMGGDFVIEGDYTGVPGIVETVEQTVDEGNDGIPDAGWVKRDISAWLEAKGEDVKSGATKRSLLKRVDEVINADTVAEVETE